MNILAIDLGKSCTGFAVLQDETFVFASSESYSGYPSPGDMYRELYNDIDCIHTDTPIDLIAVEFPAAIATKSAKVAAIQFGMLAIVEKFAADSDIGYLIYNPTETQSYTRGLTKDMDIGIDFGVKDSKVPSCELYYSIFDEAPDSHDVADAVALAVFAAAEQDIDVTDLDTVQRAA